MLQPDGRMRIVMAVHHYPPQFVAGVELVAQRIAIGMARLGHTMHVVCVDDIAASRPFSVHTATEDGVEVNRLGLQLTGHPDPLGVRHRDAALGEWFTGYLERTKPDLFHSLSSYVLSASLIDAAKVLDVPVVASLHDYWYLCPRITLLRSDDSRCDGEVTASDCARCLMRERRRGRLIDDFGKRLGVHLLDRGLAERIDDRQRHLDAVLRSVDQIVTPAMLTRELLLARGFSPESVRLVRHGLAAVPARTGSPDPQRGSLRIGYMGQFAHHKGVHVLVDAFGRLAPAGRASLVLFGDPTRFPAYSRRLREMASKNPGVEFAGAYRNDEVWSVLRRVDVLVVPSLWYEISPLVILEAFAAGVPVIASDLRNINYQVRDEEDGLLFKAGDALHLSRQLQRLIDHPELLQSLRRGIQPVHKLEDELREIESIYRQVTARTRASQPTV
jgi:glycosyltransferase involved in cell wall biosynthesis